ncbi:hypothetical protein [Azospirillum agricola]|uniref:hypothetical protein n=1 Tax=Azospirillum agricola TaxID=1720247 RepID=UPI000A0F23E5|nr:hypothetical protein [Azospirillum agricola]SMH41041.1 hypothetical protein SAMN02982994_1638 [Azospirillum lipoferum]
MPLASSSLASTSASPAALSPALVTWIGALVLVLVAFAFYGAYIDVGYNYADDGHYAQTAYEFRLGTDPHAIRFGYGLLWHKAGDWMFRVTGPSYAAVRALFFMVAGATTVLVWLSARFLGIEAPMAAVAAAIALLVPAYPATAFYGFCTLLNVAAQVPAARQGAALRARDLVLPALILSFTFQIRADFGYVFSLPLAAMVLHAGLAARERRFRRFAGLAATALGVFILGQLPLAVLAIRGGYLDLMVGEYLRYPKAITLILLRLLHLEPAAASGAGTLLPRVPLTALWAGPPDQAALALLTYGCPLVIAGFALFEMVAVARSSKGTRAGRIGVAGVVALGACASLPHYFLYRPDLPHIANFMPGFLLLSALFAARWWEATTTGSRWGGASLPGLLLLLALPLVYLWTGSSNPGTGSPALAAGRTIPFSSANGVHVRVTAGEHALLSGLREVILSHSQPGDRIVCLPFCPGIAFLAERRMLLREHYVDDSLLVTDPGWIERTIALTEAARPPLVITFDWAMNGTELSRVRNWAAPYYAYLDRVAVEKRDVLGATVHILRKAGS